MDPENIELNWTKKKETHDKIHEKSAKKLFLQTIEVVGKNLPADEHWKNRLVLGNNEDLLRFLNQHPKNGSTPIDLIYIDPPFFTGLNFAVFTELNPDNTMDNNDTEPTPPLSNEGLAYTDKWKDGLSSYLQYFHTILPLMRNLLSLKGSIFVHLDAHVVHYIKVLMDEIFGLANFRNEIVWRRTYGHHLAAKMDVQCDYLLWYTKSDAFCYHQPYEKLSPEEMAKKFPFVEPKTGRQFTHEKLEQTSNRYSKGEVRKIQGKDVISQVGWRWSQACFDDRLKQNPDLIYWTKEGRPRYKRYADEYEGRKIGNLWIDIPPLFSNSGERNGYETQKPEALLDRIIGMASDPGDIIADFFCGSGTTLVAAEKLQRRWIGCDLGPPAIAITKKRLSNLPISQPFTVESLELDLEINNKTNKNKNASKDNR